MASSRPHPRTRSVQNSSTARQIAFSVLAAYDASRPASESDRVGAPHITQLFDDHTRSWNASLQERRLAVELTYGVVRRQATLDALLGNFVTRPRANIEHGLWRLLHLGAYQLVLLGGIPPHAAVSETVALAKTLGKPQWSGFVNGVLRSLSRELTDEFETVPSMFAAPTAAVATDSAMQYRRLSAAVFPDPDREPAAYLADAFSFPRWLTDRWLAAYEWDESLRLAGWFNSPGRMSLRVNPLRTSRSDVLESLAASGVDAAAADPPAAIRLSKPMRVEELPGFSAGLISVQDESAQQAALLLDPRPGDRILDLCAAPGGKTTHLAELMRDEGQVLACDIHASRLRRVHENAGRLGLRSIDTLLIDAAAGDLPDGPFDAALIDVLCSNTGVLGKRPDARWRITPHDLVELPELQLRLLRSAIERVRPGGRIVYSTCSIEPAENEQLVRSLLDSDAGLTLLREKSHQPGKPGDGGYQALIGKQ